MSKEAGEKSEKATPQRMKQLRKDGSLQRSQDVSAWVVIGSAVAMMPIILTNAHTAGHLQLASLGDIAAAPDARAALAFFEEGLGSILKTLAPLLGVTVLAAIVAAAAQGGIRVAPKRLKPNFKQFKPKEGLKKVFGPQAWWNGLKAALKAAVIGTVLFFVIQGLVPVMLGSGSHGFDSLMDMASGGVTQLVITAIVAGLILAALDALVVQRRNRKQTRMTKKEIKDEYKKSEGDPLVKGQRRARQLAMSRNRMMAAIADADVVIVNPTHVAVALAYVPGTGAPRVVAKGQGNMATRIREEATDKRVPMVQDIPLARAMHAACELGDEIPSHLYSAVARVLAFVMALKRRGAATGIHRDPQAEEVVA